MRKGDVTMFDLRVAIGICRLSPFDSNVHKPWIIPTLLYTGLFLASLWPRRLRRATVTPGIKLNPLQRALAKRHDAFLDYCKEYLQSPEYAIIPPAHGRNHFPQTPRGRFDDSIEHAAELINWGIPEQTAWSMPLGKANVYRIMARRATGVDVDITTPEEKQFQDEMRQQFRNAG
jgi:hypothetical protein